MGLEEITNNNINEKGQIRDVYYIQLGNEVEKKCGRGHRITICIPEATAQPTRCLSSVRIFLSYVAPVILCLGKHFA